LEPLTSEIRSDWEREQATISNLSVNETTTREVFVQPTKSTEPGEYVVPVRASSNGNALDLDYFTLKVKKANFLPKVDIVEAPQTASIEAGSETNLPLLIENPGRRNISDITARIQNIEDCGEAGSGNIDKLETNETGSLQLELEASETSAECETTVIVSSGEGAYSFADLKIETTPREGLIPEEQRVPFIAIIWTFMLLLYAYFTREYSLESWTVKIPFILLLLGETIIIIYVLANQGVIQSELLPF
jgi:hypothetical protein